MILDFREAINIRLEGNKSANQPPNKVARAYIQPLRSQIVAVVRAYDVEWTTTCRMKVHKRSPPLAHQMEILKTELS